MKKLLESIFVTALIGMAVLGFLAVLIQLAGILTANAAWMIYVDEKLTGYAIICAAIVALSGFLYPYVQKKQDRQADEK